MKRYLIFSVLLVLLSMAIVVLLAALTKVQGADWVPYGYSMNSISCYYDAQSMVHTGDNTVNVWEKWVFPGEKNSFDLEQWNTLANADIRQKIQYVSQIQKEKLFRRVIDCRNRSYRTLACAIRDKAGYDMPREAVICTSSLFEDAFMSTTIKQIEPDSMLELLYRQVCK